MTTAYWLKTATQFLQSKSIPTARLDALILLEDITRLNRAQILAEPTMEIKDVWVAHLQKLLIRRSKHEPLAYIRGFSEFYGRRFKVTADVLVPRPESETIIDLLKTLEGLPEKPTIADIGAGSGALGITAKLELPHSHISLLEIDKNALEIAKSNVVLNATHAEAITSDLLLGSDRDFDILLCNLPYVPDEYPINKAAGHEPKLALFAGADGLDLYRKLFLQLQNRQKQPLFILTESLPAQHEDLAQIAAENNYTLNKTEDFIQLFSQAK